MENYNTSISRRDNSKLQQRLKYGIIFLAFIALASQFLPFIYFLFGDYEVALSGWQVLTKNIRFPDGALITLPIFMRLGVLFSWLALVGGVVLLLRKTLAWACGLFFVGGLLAFLQIPFASQLAAQASSAGLGKSLAALVSGWYVFWILSLGAAFLTLAKLGVERSAEIVFKFLATLSVGIVIIITLYMFIYGSPAIVQIGILPFIFGTNWAPTAAEPSFGILYMILASIFGCLGAMAIGVPIGLLTAVFLAEVSPRWMAKIVQPAVELLAGIPSVIYGFWGMKVVVPVIRDLGSKMGYNTTGAGLLAVILILAIMILPTIISVSVTALKSVPRTYTEGSLALGNTKISTIFGIQIPAARSGILAGVILGVGRAIGETMAVIMVAGNIVQFPTLFGSVRPMTAGIAFEMGYAEVGLHRQSLFAIGLVLFIFIMLVNITFMFISKRGVQINEK